MALMTETEMVERLTKQLDNIQKVMDCLAIEVGKLVEGNMQIFTQLRALRMQEEERLREGGQVKGKTAKEIIDSLDAAASELADEKPEKQKAKEDDLFIKDAFGD